MLFRKYAPKKISDVVGHAKVKARIMKMKREGTIGGRAFLFTGPSGIGKSSLARLVANEICDPDNVVELDATKVTTSVIDDLERRQGQLLLGVKHGRAIVLNEVHKLDSRVVGRLLTMFERINKNCTFLLTTQGVRYKQKGLFDDDDSSALESRCTVFKMEGEKYVSLFAKKAREVAIEEEIENGQQLMSYVQLAIDCEYNMRKMLSELDAGCFMPEEILEVVENQSLQLV